MNLKYLNFVILTLFFAAFTLEAGSLYGNKTEEITLPTVQCGMCKKTIEKAVKKLDGIVSISVDVDVKKAVVVFDDTKTSLTAIENTISKAGYEANSKKANKEAYDKLDDCCKMP